MTVYWCECVDLLQTVLDCTGLCCFVQLLKLWQLVNKMRLLLDIHPLYDIVFHNSRARSELQLTTQWHSITWQLSLLYGKNAIQQDSNA